MREKLRLPFDRRSGRERRVIVNRRYVREEGERRSGKERRTRGERRGDWVRLNKWSSRIKPDVRPAILK